MLKNINITTATISDADEIAVMVGELLNEIINKTGAQAFNFSLDETRSRLIAFLERENYVVFIAKTEAGYPVGFIALYESHALYAEGSFGTIPEFFVRPQFRSQNVGLSLLDQARAYGQSQGWKRLEVTTPPLPEFDKTLAFYQREGFTIAGGRKLRVLL